MPGDPCSGSSPGWGPCPGPAQQAVRDGAARDLHILRGAAVGAGQQVGWPQGEVTGLGPTGYHTGWGQRAGRYWQDWAEPQSRDPTGEAPLTDSWVWVGAGHASGWEAHPTLSPTVHPPDNLLRPDHICGGPQGQAGQGVGKPNQYHLLATLYPYRRPECPQESEAKSQLCVGQTVLVPEAGVPPCHPCRVGTL